METTLQKLKISETIVNAITKSIISEKYMHHILQRRRYCV